MLPALVLATLSFVMPRSDVDQAVSVLHIRATLVDAGGKPTPVPRHKLLVSDNPASAPPREIVTALDGTVDVKLRPGTYTVESDHPSVFQGKSYEWMQIVEIVAGRDSVLELTADNALAQSPAATTAAAPATASDPAFLLVQWQDSVMALWSPTTHATGFLIDPKGLIATSQRVVGKATAVEVQVTPNLKVSASVLVSDPVRDVAVLSIDPKVVAAARYIPLGCPQAPPVTGGQKVFTIGSPLRQPKRMTSGTVSRVDAHAIVSDLAVPSGSAGGPVFAADGTVVGITSVVDEGDESRSGNSRAARIADACDVVATAKEKLKAAAPPDGTPLPLEPARPFPKDALEEAARRRAGSLSPYTIASSSFDVAFITPVMIYGVQYQSDLARQRDRSRGTRDPAAALVPWIMDFGNWADYAGDFPPVLLVRVTPKLVEGFWMKLARGAARIQGASVPPLPHVKAGFSRLRAFCGDVQVTPIHPFKLDTRVSDKESISEGLYVFDPGAFGPQCGTVKLELYSEKEPNAGETTLVESSVVERIWQDFAPYRTVSVR